MTPLTEFSLETHAGPYESWPLKSRLLRNGQPTRLLLWGHQLLYQFRTENGFLFITDDDCMFEEITHFTLCDSNLRRLSVRFLGAPYTSFLLHRVEWLDPKRFLAIFDEYCQYLLTIRSWGIPWLRPRLKLSRRFKKPNPALMTDAEKLRELEENRRLSLHYARQGALVFAVTAPLLFIAQQFMIIRFWILLTIVGFILFAVIGNAVNYSRFGRQIRKMQHKPAS
jgi:hypothetical protein